MEQESKFLSATKICLIIVLSYMFGWTSCQSRTYEEMDKNMKGNVNVVLEHVK